MNGALTIGTLDGANIEIRDEVGTENFFLFGLDAAQVQARKAAGYRPMDIVEGNRELQDCLELLRSGFFTRGNTEVLQPLIDGLMYHDPYLVLADFQSYIDCQDQVDAAYRDTDRWTRMSILNTARSGKFSSDRSIREYCDEIWHAGAVPITLAKQAEVRTVAQE
jgi:starch phosphorylase